VTLDCASPASLHPGYAGFLGRKGDGHPGPKALWTGLQRVQEFAIGIAAAKEVFILTD
jgi:hypothetical protein